MFPFIRLFPFICDAETCVISAWQLTASKQYCWGWRRRVHVNSHFERVGIKCPRSGRGWATTVRDKRVADVALVGSPISQQYLTLLGLIVQKIISLELFFFCAAPVTVASYCYTYQCPLACNHCAQCSLSCLWPGFGCTTVYCGHILTDPLNYKV